MQLPDDLQHISPAITKLTLRYPHVSFYMWARCRIASSADVPVAATDGRTVYVNPEAIKAYALDAVVFILAHEVTHVMFEHPWLKRRWLASGQVGSLPYDEETLQKAMDYIINDFLVMGKVGRCPPEGLHDTTIGKFDEDVPTVYARLYKGEAKGGGGNSPSDGGACDGGGDVREAGTDQPGSQHKQELIRGYRLAKARGRLPAGLDRQLDELTRGNVDFREVVPRFMEGTMGRNRRSFKRPDRRRMALTGLTWPGATGSQAGTVVVVLDTSGSIGDAELRLFLGTVADLIEQVSPREIVVLDVDAKVHRSRRLARGHELAAIQREGAKGGGGTNMPAAFEWLAKEHVAPQCCVVCTDGFTPFGSDPGYPVLWAITSEGVHAPWGLSTHLQAT
jgi:predicted metal-dependent peptidase